MYGASERMEDVQWREAVRTKDALLGVPELVEVVVELARRLLVRGVVDARERDHVVVLLARGVDPRGAQDIVSGVVAVGSGRAVDRRLDGGVGGERSELVDVVGRVHDEGHGCRRAVDAVDRVQGNVLTHNGKAHLWW